MENSFANYVSLEKQFNKIMLDVDNKIKTIELKEKSIITRCVECMGIVKTALDELKDLVIRSGFNSNDEEITFFKNQKPLLLSKLIYYFTIHHLEIGRLPLTTVEDIENYYRNEWDILKSFYEMNASFYKYYRSNSTALDEKLFLRKGVDVYLLKEDYLFFDPSFNTYYDIIVAKIIAYDAIKEFIPKRIKDIIAGKDDLCSNSVSLQWTAAKSDLIELIYGLITEQCINNGNIDVKEITTAFEKVFNIELMPLVYNQWSRMKDRKIKPTKFLNKLEEGLTKRIEHEAYI